MPTVTVLAADSALAMDEVIRQLGDNAYILATNARDGQVEILATTEPAQIQPQRKRGATVSFADVISEQVAQGSGAAAVFKSGRASADAAADGPPEPEPGRSATIVMMPQARARSIDAENQTDDADIGEVSPDPSEPPLEDTGPAQLQTAPAPPDTAPTPPKPMIDAAPAAVEQAEPDLRPLLTEISARLARLEATTARQLPSMDRPHDPIQAAGFSAEIVARLAPGHAERERIALFVTAMTKALVARDPLMSLRAPVVVIVGPSGAGKTVLAAKIAALTLETTTTRLVELASLSEMAPVADSALPIYARMLSIRHRHLQPDQLDASQLLTPPMTLVLDTNLERETLSQKLAELRAQIGRMEVTVILALPVGSSVGRIYAELNKYKGLDPVIALTKLDECELSAPEASQIAETGMQIAWLSGTRALTENMAPATEEMMSEFLTGLLTVRH
jgi:flagellar biosynthesis GTPase FlhF